jgi:hypothetical protein
LPVNRLDRRRAVERVSFDRPGPRHSAGEGTRDDFGDRGHFAVPSTRRRISLRAFPCARKATISRMASAPPRAGSDRLESSLTMTGLDVDDPRFPSESFQRLPKSSVRLSKSFRKRSIPFRFVPKISLGNLYLSKLYDRICRLNGRTNFPVTSRGSPRKVGAGSRGSGQ